MVNSGKVNSCQWSYNQTGLGSFLARCVVSVAVFVPCMLGHFYFPSVISQMRKDGDLLASRVAASMILVAFIPYFVTGFVAFAFLRYIFSKL